jgi:hypothetical protein
MLSSNSSIPLLLGAIHRGGTSHSNRTSIDIRYDPPGVSDAEKRVHSYLYTLGAGNVTADSHEAQLRVHVQTLIRLLDHAKHATAPTDQACNDVARARHCRRLSLLRMAWVVKENSRRSMRA